MAYVLWHTLSDKTNALFWLSPCLQRTLCHPIATICAIWGEKQQSYLCFPLAKP